MDREEERKIIEVAQAQEWAKRNSYWYEPRWSRSRILAFCAAVVMACASCWLAWMEITR